MGTSLQADAIDAAGTVAPSSAVRPSRNHTEKNQYQNVDGRHGERPRMRESWWQPLTGVFPKWSLAIETIEHKGCQITFDVADRGKGWTWTLQIDSGPVIGNAGATHPNEILARLEAIAVAEREIESAARVAAAAKRNPGES